MHQNSNAVSWKYDVGPPRQVATVQAVAKPRGMKGVPNRELRSCVLPLNASHHAAASFAIDDVHSAVEQSRHGFGDMPRQPRWNCVTDLVILSRTRTTEKIIVRKCLETGCLAHCKTAAL